MDEAQKRAAHRTGVLQRKPLVDSWSQASPQFKTLNPKRDKLAAISLLN